MMNTLLFREQPDEPPPGSCVMGPIVRNLPTKALWWLGVIEGQAARQTAAARDASCQTAAAPARLVNREGGRLGGWTQKGSARPAEPLVVALVVLGLIGPVRQLQVKLTLHARLQRTGSSHASAQIPEACLCNADAGHTLGSIPHDSCSTFRVARVFEVLLGEHL